MAHTGIDHLAEIAVVDKPAKAEEHDHYHGHAHQNRPARSTPGLSPWAFRLFVQAQVVSIDDDPNAPASAMNPRTWTFIDGRWQFDSCR